MLVCVRTTIRLDDDLFREVKTAAAASGQSLTRFVADTLRSRLRGEGNAATRERPGIPVFVGDGLQPGVDLDDSAALLEIMES